MAGGRARKFSAEGFMFDMGPSWYWMPDVFERYFRNFGVDVKDYYILQRLDPSYRIYREEGIMNVPANFGELKALFEKWEPGSGEKLEAFLEEAAYKYEVGMHKLVYKPGVSVSEFVDSDIIKGVFKLDVFTSMRKHVSKYFKHPALRQLMEFPVLFLGALPENIPALYSLMNYADIKLGTWYPAGGMHKIVEAMEKVAKGAGVKFLYNKKVTGLKTQEKKISGVITQNGNSTEMHEADVVVGAADYHFIESLLPVNMRNYDDKYWESRTMAPSCLLYYIGLNKKLEGITHHSLFFDVDFEAHGKEIYKNPCWPAKPLFYVCAPSVSDDTVAPAGMENLFFLIPVAAGLENDTEELREKYFKMIVSRYEKHTGQQITDKIIYKKTYAVQDFVNDYNAFKGNAYGLANTLMQTAILKPSLKNKKLDNLYYTGQLTVPGPGVPPSLISGEITAELIMKNEGKI